MPIKSTGPLSFLEISNEFGGSAPHSLSEYYGDGSFLNETYFPTEPKIPKKQDKGIKVKPFYGKGKRKRLLVELKSTSEGGNIYDFFKKEAQNSPLPVDAVLFIDSGVYVGKKNSLIKAASDIKKENTPLYINAADESRATSFKSNDTLTIINNGYIIGTGGEGSLGITGTKAKPEGETAQTEGMKGSPAMWLDYKATIQNNGTIASGGKGGKGGKGSYANKVMVNSWYNCGPVQSACNDWRWVKIPGDGGCEKASGQRGDCGDDRDISDSRCNGGKWFNNALTCGCGHCRTACRQECRGRCDEGGRGRNRWKVCYQECRDARDCPDKSGPYYCKCEGRCMSWSTYNSDSKKCQNTSAVDVFYVGGKGGNGRGLSNATAGEDSTPEVIATCKGESGGDWGSNVAIVAPANIVSLTGNNPVGGTGSI